MKRKAKSLVDVAGALRRAHAALGDAIRILRKVSLRGEEAGENVHRLRLAEAHAFEARYHLGAARSVLALSVEVDEPADVPGPLRALAQAASAWATVRRLHRLRGEIERELQSLATRLGDPDVARLEGRLPAERLPLPIAEALLYGGLAVVLVGSGALVAGFTLVGAGAITVGGVCGIAAADGLRRPR